MRIGIWAVCLLTALQTGCVTETPKGEARLLDFLADGRTTRQGVVVTLGQPSARFEAEKILTYRLGYEAKTRGYYVVERETPNEAGWSTWRQAQYSLVLVCDENGVLRKHSLLEVNK